MVLLIVCLVFSAMIFYIKATYFMGYRLSGPSSPASVFGSTPEPFSPEPVPPLGAFVAEPPYDHDIESLNYDERVTGGEEAEL
jgi:hypothetical protein